MPFDPVSAVAGIAGIGFDIAGGIMGAKAASEEANISKQISGVEMEENDVRAKAMRMSAQRQSLQTLRQAQQARSYALAGATKAGAQLGSGLQGGYGSIAGESNTNMAGISQGLQSGEQMFNYANQIEALQMQMADAKSKASSASGLSAIGGSLMSISKIV